MNGCSFKKYNPRSVSEEYPEQTVRVKDVCPDPVFLDGRCFTHARITVQLPQIMDGWKLGKATPFLQHAVNGGHNAHKPTTRVSKGRTAKKRQVRLLPLHVYEELKSKKNPFRVMFYRNRVIVYSKRVPTIEDAVRARDEWLARHGEQG